MGRHPVPQPRRVPRNQAFPVPCKRVVRVEDKPQEVFHQKPQDKEKHKITHRLPPGGATRYKTREKPTGKEHDHKQQHVHVVECQFTQGVPGGGQVLGPAVFAFHLDLYQGVNERKREDP